MKSTGRIIQENRPTAEFAFVQVYDNIELIIRNDTSTTLQIEAGENLIPFISATVEDGNLILKNKNICNWARSYEPKIKIAIGQPDLQTIFQFGNGNIKTEKQTSLKNLIIHQYGAGDISLDLESENIEVDLNGIGNVNLAGTCKKISAHTYDPGSFKFGVLNSQLMSCQQYTILSETEANAYIRADSILNAEIKSSGNIFYTGPPQITLKEYKKGKLIKQD